MSNTWNFSSVRLILDRSGGFGNSCDHVDGALPGMDSSYESDKHLEIHPGDIDGSSRSNSSANSIEDVEQVDDTSTLEIPIKLPFKKSVTFASTCSSNISTEEDLQRREDEGRKSKEGISSVRVNENNPFNAVRMNVNIPSYRERNGIDQPALGDFDDDASSIVSDRSSFMVPPSPISDFTPNSTPLCLSPMQSPPLQAMDRSGTPNHYRIPSAVFAMTSSPPIEWSLASNESLFSLHIGNNSFTKDQVVVVNSDTTKSCEPRKSIEVVATSEGLPFDDSIANMEKIFQSNKPIDILEDLQKGCENEPSMELSHATTSSHSELPRAPSFSIPVKKRRSSKSAGTQFCCHATKCASSSCCCSNCSSICSCCDNCSGKRLWCSILLCGLPEVAKCCKSEKTQKPKASSKSDTDDCFLCSCFSCSSCCSFSSCNSCGTCPSCKSCCSCPSCQHSCSYSSCFPCSSCHSCCSCWSCSFPSCKSCCNCPCRSCCTFPSCHSCCSCNSCQSCCSYLSCHSCCSCPSCPSCCSYPSCPSCCPSTTTCYCCKSC